MPHLRQLRLARGAVWLAIFVSFGVLAGVVFIASGAYNVAANERHFNITESLITFALDRSVSVRGERRSVPDLDDPGLVRLGALHFENGCAACHGRPGRPASPIVQGMYPSPPPLDGAAREWSVPELGWIVHNGLKMTGMPAWPGKGREDEVWPVVAFIMAIPEIDAAEYDTLTGPVAHGKSLPIRDPETMAEFCEACHGSAESPPASALAPPLTNQSPEYLYRSLEEYRAGLRQSGMMEPIAAELSDDQMRALAMRLGGPPGAVKPPPIPAGRLSPGAELAWRGDPARDLPSCFGCHGERAGPDFPRLQGLSGRYVANQLELFRNGVRGLSAQGRVMAHVAGRLSDDDMEAVAEYIGRLNRQEDLAAASARAQ
ncbi:c-type cytochrome [Microbaculum marinum]|uniref:C-type cytochrome n=1 Tax=Microbaculum marinum TaxID=1764581 RepID=A0AAW9RQE4_9HYPH